MKSSSVENLSDLLCIVLMPNYMYMSSLGLAAHATTCMCPRYAHIYFFLKPNNLYQCASVQSIPILGHYASNHPLNFHQ